MNKGGTQNDRRRSKLATSARQDKGKREQQETARGGTKPPLFTHSRSSFAYSLSLACSKETAFKYPWLYRDGQNNNFMTTPIFFRWVGEGMAHAIFVFFISVGCHHSGIFDKEGKSLDLFTIGTIVNMMAVVVASGRLYCETRYFNFPTFYKPQGGGLFFEGLVSWTGSGWSWQLLSFGFWWWSFYLFSKKGEEYALHGYFKELGGSWQILSQDAGLYCCMFLAMAFTVGLTFALFLAPDQFSKPLLSTLAAETDKLDKQTADDQSGTVVEQV